MMATKELQDLLEKRETVEVEVSIHIRYIYG